MSADRRRAHLLCGILLCPLPVAAQSGAPVRFPSTEIVFRSSTISFPATALAFPSAPLQTETASTIEISLPSDVLFDFDKADLRPEAQGALRELAQIIKGKSRGPVAIQGHTDALGGDSYNQKLSERRAGAVKLWLSAREDVPSNKLGAAGFGARNPVAPNRRSDGSDDPDGRQLNRRVTIIIRK